VKGLYGQFSCAMPRDPRMVAAGFAARLVYMEAALYCRENLTDGIIDRLTLAFWTPDMPVRTKITKLDRLAEVGALEVIPAGWRIPEDVWREWNPTKDEVNSKRQLEAERKAEYRARRQLSQESPNGTQPDARVTATRCPRQPETEPKPETKTEPYKSPLDSYDAAHGDVGEVIKGMFQRTEDVA
jgi:hypothetical protein